MADCEKLIVHDGSSDSVHVTSGPLASSSSRCCESLSATLVSSRALSVFIVVILVALTTVCVAQCVGLRRENAEIRLLVERLQARVDRQFDVEYYDNKDDSIEVDSSLHYRSTAERYNVRAGRRRRSATNQDQQQNSQRRIAMHFKLDEHNLNQRKSAGGEINYTDPDNVRWKPASWSSISHHLSVNNFTIDEAGLYFVYGQLTYFNAAATSAFDMKLDDRTILRCLQSVDVARDISSSSSGSSAAREPSAASSPSMSADNARVKSCYTAGVVAVSANERLSIVNRLNRAVICNSHANFWGFIRLNDT